MKKFKFLVHFLSAMVILISTHLNLTAQCTTTRVSFVKRPCNVKVDTVNIPKKTDFINCGFIQGVDTITPILPFQAVPGAPASGNACDSVCFSKLIRTWNLRITNGLGNFVRNEVYKDSIGFTQIKLIPTEGFDTVACPKDTVIYCSIPSSVDTSVAKLGSPLGSSSVLCNILQTNPTTTLWQYKSRGCYKFSRTWNLIDWCSQPAQMKTCTQIVEIRDTIKPVAIANPPLPDQNVSGDGCTAKFLIPPVMATDNCSLASELKYKITIAGVELTTNGGMVAGIPIGTHSIDYSINDGCGNILSFSSSVTVIDKAPPIALCKGPKTVAVPASGMAILPKETFNDGSFDRCTKIVSTKIRRMNNTPVCFPMGNEFNRFGDDIKICCADAGTDVMVILRVYQYDIPEGELVSLDGYPGVPYSDCMTSVKVLDKVGPTISCPVDTTIDCRDISLKRVKSLTAYGMAMITDMCLDTVWIDSIPSLNECNVGTIIRKINARDDAGNISTCSQTIRVVNNDPFDANDTSDLVWPKDTTFFICSANIASAVTGVPILKDKSCTKLAYNSEDETYAFAPGACKKILRKWTVVDWCQVDPKVKGSGRWSYTQKIVVMDTAKPVLTVPANVIANNNSADCTPIHATIGLPTATDCTPENSLEWSYTTDLYSDGNDILHSLGKNASQSLPNGVHTIVFTVNDNCGNSTSKSITVTVKDTKKPTPMAIHGLATDLGLMNGVGMVRVNARQFFLPGSAFDNCTAFNKLKFSFTANVLDTVRTYTCDSIGTRNVRLWITDEANNQDFVTTYILIQNNMNACTSPSPINTDPSPSLRTAGIEGTLATEAGKYIDQVTLKIMQNNTALPDPTIIEGKYAVSNLPIGVSYEIVPKKDINPFNGVSTVDLILMQKHILGVKSLHTPYKMIAADIDKDGEITTSDLLELRKLILGIETKFAQNESWRFVDAAYQFKDLNTALKEPFTEKYVIKDMTQSMKINFIGVKIGDVNESSIPNSLSSLEARESSPSFIELDDKWITKNEIIQVPIKGTTLDKLSGHQLGLSLQGIEFLQIIPGYQGQNEVVYHQQGNKLKILSTPINGESNKTWYTLVFKANQAGKLSQALQVFSDEWRSEVYNEDLVPSQIALKWNTAAKAYLQVLQNAPNPFTAQTQVSYFMPQHGTVQLKVLDLNGKVLFTDKVQATKGYNQWIITKDQLPTNGIYYYRIESAFGTDANKMILMR